MHGFSEKENCLHDLNIRIEPHQEAHPIKFDIEFTIIVKIFTNNTKEVDKQVLLNMHDVIKLKISLVEFNV